MGYPLLSERDSPTRFYKNNFENKCKNICKFRINTYICSIKFINHFTHTIMATRSFISIKTGKEFRTIYCHWNGYPEYNGVVLLKHYSTIERIEALLALGSVSSIDKELAPEAGTLHSFDKPQDGVVVAYHRDRSETLNKARCHTYRGLEREDYNYVFNSTTNTWFVRPYNGTWQPLAKVIAAIDPKKLQA